MDRPASDFAQSGLNSPRPPLADAHSEPPAAEQAPAAAATAAAAAAQFTSQAEARPTPQTQPEVRPATTSSATPQPDYALNQATARPAAYPDYLARQPQYHHPPNTQAGGAAGMAQATSPSTTQSDGQKNDHRNQNQTSIKSDPDVPIDPSIAASSPTYPPPYSPYQPQGHDMAQYQGHPPPQMYARPEWSHGYGQHQHGMPGPYSSPATTVGSASPAAVTAGPRPGQVRLSNGSGALVPMGDASESKRMDKKKIGKWKREQKKRRSFFRCLGLEIMIFWIPLVGRERLRFSFSMRNWPTSFTNTRSFLLTLVC